MFKVNESNFQRFEIKDYIVRFQVPMYIAKSMKLVKPINDLTQNMRNDFRISMLPEISSEVHLVVFKD